MALVDETSVCHAAQTKATNGRYWPCKMTFFQNERRNVLYSQKFPSGIEVYRV
jgi:hypothetical protein